MIGYRYRLAMTAFFLMWSATYLMQKSSYNNHYYLTALLSFLMILLPANNSYSLDVRRKPELKSNAAPFWTSLVLMLQIALVYFYGGIAKIYPDWLQAIPARIFLASKANFPVIGPLLTSDWFPYFLSYGGLLFDLFIVPLLFFRKTRLFGFCLSIFFHLFNAIVFQVGIFPFLSLAFAVFFFKPKTVHKIFLPKKPFYDGNEIAFSKYKTPIVLFLGFYFAIQLLLPLRHWVIKDDVLWTEEGHRLSWRMMLRAKSGHQTFTIVDKASGTKELVKLSDHLTKKQIRSLSTKPDFIWQFSQHLKKHYGKNGKDVAVYIKGKVRVNGRTAKTLVHDTIDMAAINWTHFNHSEWLLPSKN